MAGGDGAGGQRGGCRSDVEGLAEADDEGLTGADDEGLAQDDDVGVAEGESGALVWLNSNSNVTVYSMAGGYGTRGGVLMGVRHAGVIKGGIALGELGEIMCVCVCVRGVVCAVRVGSGFVRRGVLKLVLG